MQPTGRGGGGGLSAAVTELCGGVVGTNHFVCEVHTCDIQMHKCLIEGLGSGISALRSPSALPVARRLPRATPLLLQFCHVRLA